LIVICEQVGTDSFAEGFLTRATTGLPNMEQAGQGFPSQ
jgi:hypothetical protein